MREKIKLEDIIEFLDTNVKQVFGNPENIFITNLNSSNNVDKHTLDWINPVKENKQSLALNTKARVIIVSKDVNYTSELKKQGKILIVVDNPKLTIARIGSNFFAKKIKPGIHPSAVIHPEANLGYNVFIGPNCTIGNCSIGNNVIIHSNTVISDNCIIGNNVIIKAGVILGFDGFGYERDEKNNLIKFPQLGKLIINDQVEIGSNTCIDKGSLSDTIIGFNTKINNLCHIAHNVVIGNNVVITAHVNISGSTTIEDDVWIAPNASLRGHQKIGTGATIGTGAVVTKDVPKGETWIGNPAKKLIKK